MSLTDLGLLDSQNKEYSTMVFITSKYPPSSNIEARARKLHEKFKNLQQLQWGLLDKFNSEFPSNWEGSEQNDQI